MVLYTAVAVGVVVGSVSTWTVGAGQGGGVGTNIGTTDTVHFGRCQNICKRAEGSQG